MFITLKFLVNKLSYSLVKGMDKQIITFYISTVIHAAVLNEV